jgi:hypothetical protein
MTVHSGLGKIEPEMMHLLLHSALWVFLSAVSLSGWGTPVPGLLLATLLAPGLSVWSSKRWASWGAAMILPVLGLSLFYGTVLLVPQVLPLPPVEDATVAGALAAETSLALDTLAAGIAVSGLLAPPVEAWVQSRVVGDKDGFLEWVRGSYLAIGAALGSVLLLWNLPLDQLQAWSGTLSPAKVGAVAVGGLVGGIRGAWHTRMLRDLPPKG